MYTTFWMLLLTNNSSVPKYSWTIFACSAAFIILFFSTIPLQLPPIDTGQLSVDKLLHSTAYFILSSCVGLSLWLDWHKTSIRKVVFSAVFLFGMILEIIQEYALSYRTFEVYDLLANSLGIITFLVTGKTIKKIVAKSGIFIN